MNSHTLLADLILAGRARIDKANTFNIDVDIP